MPNHDPNRQQDPAPTQAMPANDPLDTSQPLPPQNNTAPQPAAPGEGWQSQQSFYTPPADDAPKPITLPSVADLTALVAQNKDNPSKPEQILDMTDYAQAQHTFIKAQTAFLNGEHTLDADESQLRTDLNLIITYSKAQGKMIEAQNTLLEQAGVVE